MDEIIKSSKDEYPIEESCSHTDVVEVAEEILADTRTEFLKAGSLSVPISQLSTLGAGVASLLPALRTVTQTTTVNTQGLYRLANASVGDALKIAKNGNFWGAFKKAGGGSKFAQLQEAGPLTGVSKTVMPINPATMMMAVALFSIEQQLGNIADMEKQILSAFEIEKKSEIEGDVETLNSIITKYKLNWDNDLFVSGNHKITLDIQRTARKNMLSYQKTVADRINSKKLIVAQAQVNSSLQDMQEKFKYYRLSLYTYAMASFIEIMLSGNFKEENIVNIISEIEQQSHTYRELFKNGSVYLEKMTKASVETNVLKGVGTATKAVGKFIGNIPVVNKSPVDEFLQDSGAHLRRNARGMERDILSSFAEISNPGTGVFMDKMRDMIQIYNHTTEICFDNKKIYLIA